VTFGHVVFEMGADIHTTNRHTDTLAILHTSPRDEVIRLMNGTSPPKAI